MSATIEINDAGQAVLEIADSDGEVWKYRFRLIPPGLSLWALELTGGIKDSTYRVAEDSPGRWDCSCDLQQKGKRDQKPCKHIRCVRSARSCRQLGDFLRAESAAEKPKENLGCSHHILALRGGRANF